MLAKLTERLGRPLATLVTIAVLLLALAGTATAALTVNEIWSRIKPKADARYLQDTKVYVDASGSVAPTSSDTVIVNCPAGWQALGGGVDFVTQAVTGVYVNYDGPMVDGDNLVAAADGRNPPATGWKVRVQNTNAVGTYTFSVGVICSS